MKQYRASTAPCPIGRASRVLGDRWVLLVMREAFLGATRFEQFMDRLDISRAALSSRLAILVDAGLMVWEPENARRAEYHLTDAGRDLAPLYREMARWGAEHLFAGGQASPEWPGDLPKGG